MKQRGRSQTAKGPFFYPRTMGNHRKQVMAIVPDGTFKQGSGNGATFNLAYLRDRFPYLVDPESF